MKQLQTRKVWLVVTEQVTDHEDPANWSYTNGLKLLATHLLDINGNTQVHKWLVFTEVVSTIDPSNFSYVNGTRLITTAFLREESFGGTL